MRKMTKFVMMFVMGIAVLFTGCSEDSKSPVASSDSKVKVRVIHTSYDAPAVDVSVNNNVVISGLGYGLSSGYAELDAGNASIKVTPSGASNPVVINADLVLEADKEFTIFASGSLSNIAPVVVEDNRQSVSNKAKIRFAHMSPDAPAVDIKLNDGNGPVVFGNVAFKGIENYVEVDEGTYVFAVTPANSTDEVIVFDPIMVENELVYTVMAKGTLNANDDYPFVARVLVDNAMGNTYVDLTAFGSANVQVIHASPDAPGVDLLVDDMISGTNLEFPMNTEYLPVAAGMRNIKVNVSGTSTTAIEDNIDFMKDIYYSVFAVNEVASIEPLLIMDELTMPAVGNAHVRFIHLSPDAPAVDITTTDGTVVFGDKSFKEYSDFMPLAAGNYDLQVRLSGTDTVVLDLPGVMLEDGRIYTVFAKGFVNGQDKQALGAQIIVNM
jgi:hypothetical protein